MVKREFAKLEEAIVTSEQERLYRTYEVKNRESDSAFISLVTFENTALFIPLATGNNLDPKSELSQILITNLTVLIQNNESLNKRITSACKILKLPFGGKTLGVESTPATLNGFLGVLIQGSEEKLNIETIIKKLEKGNENLKISEIEAI